MTINLIIALFFFYIIAFRLENMVKYRLVGKIFQNLIDIRKGKNVLIALDCLEISRLTSFFGIS